MIRCVKQQLSTQEKVPGATPWIQAWVRKLSPGPDVIKSYTKTGTDYNYNSLDMFNHPVLKPNSSGVGSDCNIDYGLVGARGYKTSQTPQGWSCSYTYANAGEFDLTIVLTNHGYSDADFKQTVHNGGKVTVK